jgi:hypothetical protein
MKTPDLPEGKPSAPEQANTTTSKFTGTDNPRHLRAIHALLTRPMPREHLDRAAGCSNGPELVAELRRRGLELPCERVPDTDRDGRPIKRGVYHFIQSDRNKIIRWMASRQHGIVDFQLAGLLALCLVCVALMYGVL